MEKRDRAYRRYVRQKAVAKAFEVCWREIVFDNNVYRRRLGNREITYLETNQERWDYQNHTKQEVQEIALQRADNMRWCSCYLCSRYSYEQELHMGKEKGLILADSMDFEDFLSFQNSGV